MSKVLKRLAANDSRIQSYSDETQHGDGHWLYLKPGWNWSTDHVVRGETVKEVLHDFKEIEPCPVDCECRKTIIRSLGRNIASALAIFAALALVGCGGGSMTPVPSATPSVITSAQVFSNTPQTWNFSDELGHHMTITPYPITCAFGSCGDITVWHFTKDSCLGYWANRTAEQCAVATNLDELYFVLRHDTDGAWRCIGFTDIDYLGVKRKVQINTVPGMAPPYTIIPAASNVSDPDTAYNALIQTLAFDADLSDFSAPTGGTAFSTTWRTDASQESGSLVSLQHEGCVTEHWDFSNGLTRIVPLVGLGNGGACLTMDTKLTMVRQ